LPWLPIGIKVNHCSMNVLGQLLVEKGGSMNHNAQPNQIEHALKQKGCDQKDRKRNQRRHAAAGEHTIVNLEHVKRSREH